MFWIFIGFVLSVGATPSMFKAFKERAAMKRIFREIERDSYGNR